MAHNKLIGCSYYEPYAGGGGAALNLLYSGAVSEIYLNDADVAVYAFWHSILNHPKKFCEKIDTTSVSSAEWIRQRDIYRQPCQHATFELGFATFFLNRCNRSGIIKSGGPIGGLRQAGDYQIDARFPKQNLKDRIIHLSQYRKSIHISNLDALKFLVTRIPKRLSNNFVYLDPPYIEQGRRLYYDNYKQRDHEALAKYLCSLKHLKWVVSYDSHPLLKQFYSSANTILARDAYRTERRIRETEILFFPKHLALPIRRSKL